MSTENGAAQSLSIHVLRRALAALVALGLPLAGQAPEWTKQAPLPTGQSLQSIAVLSPTEVWGAASPMLGNVGTLVHTTDAGATWDVHEFPSGQLNAVFFLDALHGWAAGNGFHHTTDGGQTWIQDNSWGSIYDLFFLDPLHGWACGNGSVNYRTTDGGLTWSTSQKGGTTMSSIWFVDLLEGWSVNIGGQILHSVDGGLSWTIVHSAGEYLSTIQFFDKQEGWAIGGDTFLHTTNGGQSWTKATVPAGTWAHEARFADRLHGVAVGQSGNVVRTVDGGVTWTQVQPMGSGILLNDVEAVDPTTWFYGGSSGTLARSTDGGLTWTSITSGSTNTTNAIDAVDALVAFSANDGGEIARTTDGGGHWVRTTVGGFDANGEILDVDFVDPTTGWAVGSNDHFGGSDGRISRSDDGGLTWTLQLSAPSASFSSIAAVDSQTAFVTSSWGASTVIRTMDGGLNWLDASPPSGSFRAICFVDALTGWVAGDGIYKTTDGGMSWVQQHTGGATLAEISFADALNGWASGYANTLLHTRNGGQTWTPQSVPGAPSLTAFMGVSAVSPTEAWIAGWYGFVAGTTDGGLTWTQEQLPDATSAYFECAAFTDAETGWVGGDLGIWHRGTAALAASPSSISIASGGSQTFTLDAGAGFAGDIYLLLGTLSGTSPGTPAGSFTLPLNPDFYLLFSLANPNKPPLASTLGFLDASGKAGASLTLGPGQIPLLLGFEAHHAFAVLNASALAVVFVSNPVPLAFLP
jgi:photosystem II stability/assembly factor-like uncharacterized protein